MKTWLYFLVILGMFSLSCVKNTSFQPVNAFFNGRLLEGISSSDYRIVGSLDNPFVDPVAITYLDDSCMFICEKVGKIILLCDLGRKIILDISSRTHSIDDAGLINLVLHPDFDIESDESGYLYILYRYHSQGDEIGGCNNDAFIRLSRFKWNTIDRVLEENSELVLVQQYDPHCWHMGGGMFFGKEGYLYFAIGDAGGLNDEYHSTQQISNSFFGGLHRIDVDRDSINSHPIRRQPSSTIEIEGERSYTQYYYIPNDNPWTSESGAYLEEFYALGLRNPHRMSYDPVDDQIWVADVGQAKREELNLVAKGDNLQWPFREGSLAGPREQPKEIIGNSRGPVFEYDHSLGTAIIGGFVYRGDKFPQLYGKYIFADDGTRKVWAYNFEHDSMEYLATVSAGGIGPKNGISSVEKDDEGNVYVLKLFGTDLDGGQIYQLQDNSGTGGLALKLSDLNIFRDLHTEQPSPGLMPYDLHLPQWNNDMSVRHWVSIPNDGVFNDPSEQVVYSGQGTWKFPNGTVFVQHFQRPTNVKDNSQNIETRILVISGANASYGVSYKWNEEGTEAYLVTETHQDTFFNSHGDKRVFSFLSPSDCLNCHNASNGFVLGVKTSQMNCVSKSGGLSQMELWQRNNIFGSSLTSSSIQTQENLSGFSSDSDLPEKLASYLDVNCSACHHPRGMMPSFDARFRGKKTLTDLINKQSISPNSSRGDFLISPGDPERSIVFQRINTCEDLPMPPIGRSEIDTIFRDSLYEWIRNLLLPVQ